MLLCTTVVRVMEKAIMRQTVHRSVPGIGKVHTSPRPRVSALPLLIVKASLVCAQSRGRLRW